MLAVGAVITDSQGRVLLVLRGNDPQKDRWSLPGGSVEPGEALIDAVEREVLEETGLHVRVGEELWRLRIPARDGRVFDVHDFAATVIGGDLKFGDDANDARWVAATEFESLPLTTDLADYLGRAGIVLPDS
ncbi:MAG: NUDIX domain-containing protein [Terrimesophilobacter sp.]